MHITPGGLNLRTNDLLRHDNSSSYCLDVLKNSKGHIVGRFDTDEILTDSGIIDLFNYTTSEVDEVLALKSDGLYKLEIGETSELNKVKMHGNDDTVFSQKCRPVIINGIMYFIHDGIPLMRYDGRILSRAGSPKTGFAVRNSVDLSDQYKIRLYSVRIESDGTENWSDFEEKCLGFKPDGDEFQDVRIDIDRPSVDHYGAEGNRIIQSINGDLSPVQQARVQLGLYHEAGNDITTFFGITEETRTDLNTSGIYSAIPGTVSQMRLYQKRGDFLNYPDYSRPFQRRVSSLYAGGEFDNSAGAVGDRMYSIGFHKFFQPTHFAGQSYGSQPARIVFKFAGTVGNIHIMKSTGAIVIPNLVDSVITEGYSRADITPEAKEFLSSIQDGEWFLVAISSSETVATVPPWKATTSTLGPLDTIQAKYKDFFDTKSISKLYPNETFNLSNLVSGQANLEFFRIEFTSRIFQRGTKTYSILEPTRFSTTTKLVEINLDGTIKDFEYFGGAFFDTEFDSDGNVTRAVEGKTFVEYPINSVGIFIDTNILFSLFASTDGLDFRKLDTDIPYRGRELTYSKGYIDSVIENGLNIESFIDTRKARIEPPRGKFLTTFQNGLVIGNVSNLAVGDRQLSSKDSVFWSFSGSPERNLLSGANQETFSHINSISIGDGEDGDISGLWGGNDILSVHKDRASYYVSGDFTTNSLRRTKIITGEIGCVSDKSINDIMGGHVYMTQLGVYASTGITVKEISEVIRPLFVDSGVKEEFGFSTEQISNTVSVNDRLNRYIHFFIPDRYMISYSYDYGEWFFSSGINTAGGVVRRGDEVFLSDGTKILKVNDDHVRGTYATNWINSETPHLKKSFQSIIIFSNGTGTMDVGAQGNWRNEFIKNSLGKDFQTINYDYEERFTPARLSDKAIRFFIKGDINMRGIYVEMEKTQRLPRQV